MKKWDLVGTFFMATRLKTVFLKQECVTKSAFICLVLLGLIGAIVILCDGYKGSYLGLSAILASYSIMVWWILSLLTYLYPVWEENFRIERLI